MILSRKLKTVHTMGEDIHKSYLVRGYDLEYIKKFDNSQQK